MHKNDLIVLVHGFSTIEVFSTMKNPHRLPRPKQKRPQRKRWPKKPQTKPTPTRERLKRRRTRLKKNKRRAERLLPRPTPWVPKQRAPPQQLPTLHGHHQDTVGHTFSPKVIFVPSSTLSFHVSPDASLTYLVRISCHSVVSMY